MYTLITRPQEEAIIEAQKWQEMDYACLIEPMIEIEYQSLGLSLEPYNAIIVTSKNALKAIAGFNFLGKIIAVGPQTAEFANKLGFTNILCAESNVKSLINIIDHSHSPALYLRGDVVTVDLKALLPAKGVQIDETIVYTTKARDNFSAKLIEYLQAGEIEQVLLFSSRTAQIFCTLMTKHNLDQYSHPMKAIVLSTQIAEQISQLTWRDVGIIKL
jgi:uroporphyrinogen-III synthase